MNEHRDYTEITNQDGIGLALRRGGLGSGLCYAAKLKIKISLCILISLKLTHTSNLGLMLLLLIGWRQPPTKGSTHPSTGFSWINICEYAYQYS